MTEEKSVDATQEGLPAANARIRMPRFELGERLTREQIDFFETYGFIRFKGFASRALVSELCAGIEEADRRLVAEGRRFINGVPLVIGERPDGSRYVQRMPFASLFSDALHRFLKDPRFAAITEFAGPGFRIGERERDGLVVNHYRNEPGSRFSRQGWHTDSLRDLAYFERPRRYLNVGFYYDDCPISKGGVRLIPGSHRQNAWDLVTRKLYFLDNRPDPEEYAITAEAGDLTFHDGRIWHRVAQAAATGAASQRRISYLPFMEGPVKLKDESSPMPFYFRLRKLVGHN